MRIRRVLVVSAITACVALPILIGASCPPPTSPAYLSFTTCNVNAGVASTPLPACTPGLVCIEIVNTTGITIQVALYYDDGCDTKACNKNSVSLFSCCPNPNSQVACPCLCPGYTPTECNCELNFALLFQQCNLKNINGARVLTLAPGQRVTAGKINAQSIKTMGVAVARDSSPEIVLSNPAFEDGPVFRRRTVSPPEGPGKDFVGSGQTVRFSVFDINETNACTGEQDLVSLAIRHETPPS